MKTKRYIHALAGLGLASAMYAQAPFSLDTTFRTYIQDQYVNSLVVLPSGDLLLSGAIHFPGDLSTRYLAKIDGEGSQVLSFPFGYGGGKLTPWNDRFYVAVGQSIARVLASGAGDASFIQPDADPYFSSMQGGDYHVYPDGRVLMSGAHTLNDVQRGFVGNYNLIWFSNQGYLDTTRVHRKGNGVVYNFAELPDSGFICSGTCTQFDGIPVGRIFRTDADGIPDPSFQSDVYTGRAFTYLPLTDGRIYTGGNFRRNANPLDTLRLVRFMPDGSLDPTFTMPQFAYDELIYPLGPTIGKVTPYMDGKLFIMGDFQYVNGQSRRGICVIDSAGALMNDFDGCGVGVFTYMGLASSTVQGIAPYDDEHWIIWGGYTGYNDGTTNDTLQRFVTRLHVGDITTGVASTTKEPLFNLYPNPSSGSVTLALGQVPKSATLLVRDALGRVVQRQRVSDHYTTLTLASSGVYAVELWSNSERVAVERVVVE
ncbi:MAG TPA: T9SS type A sorting domain-containing protein [Flavobacteriales bacterium]|nr:T9SS type A sorting domain-containing protein [Flavobacteriales bacterium]